MARFRLVAVTLVAALGVLAIAAAELDPTVRARFIYYGLNYNRTSPVVGHVSNGSIMVYDIGHNTHSELLRDEAGITAIDVEGTTLYYFTARPMLLKSVDLTNAGAAPQILANLTTASDGDWDAIVHMRVTSKGIYWNLGMSDSWCGCIERSELDGTFITGEMSGLVFGNGFVVDETNQVIYASAGTNEPTCFIGGFGNPTKNFTISGNGFAACEDMDWDRTTGLLYFGGTINMKRSKMDGTEMTDLCQVDTCGYVNYLKVDVAGGRLYWLTAARQFMSSFLSGEAPFTMFALPDPSTAYPPYPRGFALGGVLTTAQ